MDPRLRLRVEIETLHELINELDYYKMLKVEPQCAQDEIGNAFRRESRRLHPDRMAAFNDNDIKDKANYIFTAVNEAFRTLKTPEGRLHYDQELSQGNIRMADTSLTQQGQSSRGAASDPEHAATNPMAEKYWKLGLRAWNDKDYRSCVLNIKLALQFEKDNEVFKEWLAKAEEASKADPQKGNKNPYKLRLV